MIAAMPSLVEVRSPQDSRGRRKGTKDAHEDTDVVLPALLRPQRVLVDDAVQRQEKSRPCEVPACPRAGVSEELCTPRVRLQVNADVPVTSDHNHPRYEHH